MPEDITEKLYIDDYLGNDVKERFRYAYPVLRLLVTRVVGGRKNAGEAVGLLYANNGLPAFGYDSWRSTLAGFFGVFRYILNGWLSRKSADILLSDNLLLSERYSRFQETCLENSRITGISLVYHYMIGNGFRYRFPRQVSLGARIVDSRIIRQITIVYDILYQAYVQNTICNSIPYYSDEIERLDGLIRKRVRHIRKKLGKSGVKQYITNNQYRIEEILIILACKEQGIETKEWMHSTYGCVFDVDEFTYSPECRFVDQNSKFVFANCLCYWNTADVQWLRLYANITPIIYEGVEGRVTGSPEVSRREIELKLRNAQNRESVCVFMPPISDFHYNKKRNEIISEVKARIIEQLKVLSQKKETQILVRYHPADKQENYKSEIEKCIHYGFEVLDSSRSSFERVLMTSNVVIGFATTALCVAANYGIKSYFISIPQIGKYDLSGSVITQISIDAISEIDVNEKQDSIASDAMNLNELYRL